MLKLGFNPDAKNLREWDVQKIKQEICLDVNHITPPAS